MCSKEEKRNGISKNGIEYVPPRTWMCSLLGHHALQGNTVESENSVVDKYLCFAIL